MDWLDLLAVQGTLVETYITRCKTESQCKSAQRTQTGARNNLEGWGGEGGGREVQEGRDIRMPMADSC